MFKIFLRFFLVHLVIGKHKSLEEECALGQQKGGRGSRLLETEHCEILFSFSRDGASTDATKMQQ